MHTKRFISPIPFLVPALVVLSPAGAPPPAVADDTNVPDSDTYVTWFGGPCTEPVLMIDTDKENVRSHIPPDYPGTDNEFMSHVVTTVGTDGGLKATIVFTLNRCRDNEIVTTVNGEDEPSMLASDVSEVLVMVLWDGASDNAFEFYEFASYVSEPSLADAYDELGLPSEHTSDLVYQLDADPEAPEPGAVVPYEVEIPGAFRVEGTVVRPLVYGEAGHATHHYHGPRGELWVEHSAPTGGQPSTTDATVTVTGDDGAWLADLLGAQAASGTGVYLEKDVGHSHRAYLID